MIESFNTGEADTELCTPWLGHLPTPSFHVAVRLQIIHAPGPYVPRAPTELPPPPRGRNCALMILFTTAAALLALLPACLALPTPGASITDLSTTQITSYKPYTLYASAAYCNATETSAWSCGSNCKGNPSFVPTASGGDGTLKQYCEYRLCPQDLHNPELHPCLVRMATGL